MMEQFLSLWYDECSQAELNTLLIKMKAGQREQMPGSDPQPQQELLLTTKLYIPPVRFTIVPRPRLIERLNAGMQRKLTLVSAPAGFGKTTLLSAWSAAAIPQSWRVAWLSLDAGDNDPTRFWTYVIAALETVYAGIGANVQAQLRSTPAPPMEPLLIPLMNRLAAMPGDLVLVLDDYHLVETPSIHQALTFLLDHQPPQLHLLIACRIDPPLPVARLRAQGHLAELRLTDLRFTAAETTHFFHDVMGLNLNASERTALEAKAEGWIAGLYLAALALQGRASDSADFVAEFTGSHRYVLDYLLDEVLQRQPEGLQSFLLKTSILDLLNSSLCDAVTGSENSRAVLEQLERANLFLVPLDDKRHWYRYHHLFAEFLRSRLQQTQPAVVPALHQQAAAWYEHHDMMTPAVNHALAAQDFVYMMHLLEQSAATLMKRNEITTLLTWLRALPAHLVHSSPRLCIVYAWVLTSVNHLSEAAMQLHEAERVLRETQPEASIDDRSPSLAPLHGEIAAIRASIASFQGDIPATIASARQALDRLPEENVFMRGITALSLGRAYLLSGDVRAAHQALNDARALNQASGNVAAALSSNCSLGYLHLIQGHFHRAAAIFRVILDDASQQGSGSFPIVSMAYGGMGEVLYEWYELEAAEEHLLKAIELGKQWGYAGNLFHHYISLALVKQAQGDGEQALRVLDELEQLLPQDTFTTLSTTIRTFRVFLEVAQGQVETALHWAEEHRFLLDRPFTSQDDFERLVLAHIYIAQGRYDEAEHALEPLLPAEDDQQRRRSVIERLVLLALVQQKQGHIDEAIDTLAHALVLAEPEGYVLTFVNKGKAVAALLDGVLSAQQQGKLATPRHISPVYAGRLLHLLEGETRSEAIEARASGRSQPLAEPLSEREREVLQAIAAGRSNRDLAEEFVVSVGTIKTHLNNIYGKLNVHSRTQAIARARELHLLP